jgi:hypothetical protein
MNPELQPLLLEIRDHIAYQTQFTMVSPNVIASHETFNVLLSERLDLIGEIKTISRVTGADEGKLNADEEVFSHWAKEFFVRYYKWCDLLARELPHARHALLFSILGWFREHAAETREKIEQGVWNCYVIEFSRTIAGENQTGDHLNRGDVPGGSVTQDSLKHSNHQDDQGIARQEANAQALKDGYSKVKEAILIVASSIFLPFDISLPMSRWNGNWSPGTNWPQDMPLRDLIENGVKEVKREPVENHTGGFHRAFNAETMDRQRIFEIVHTDNLAEHLTMSRDSSQVFIYTDVGYLRLQLESEEYVKSHLPPIIY